MSTSRKASILTIALALMCVGAWLAYGYGNVRQEETRIRIRYQQMVSALSSGNTNAAMALIAPENRRAASRSLGLLTGFIKPLGPRSSVRFSTFEAHVCPERIFHLGAIPGGNTIGLIKVHGEWYFTGGFHVD